MKILAVFEEGKLQKAVGGPRSNNDTSEILMIWKMYLLSNIRLFWVPARKTNMARENPPFEDVFPIENGDFPMSC